jgi:hypothetical protein
MSENIQSIANGTFVLGTTSATNFVGGTGITIDSPSEGTVRISNDETVLWSGANAVAACNLSEPLSAFETFKIYIAPEMSTDYLTTVVEFTTNGAGHEWDASIGNGVNNAWLSLIYLTASNDYTSISATKRKALNFGAYTATTTAITATTASNPTVMQKVIGINRKEV